MRLDLFERAGHLEPRRAGRRAGRDAVTVKNLILGVDAQDGAAAGGDVLESAVDTFPRAPACFSQLLRRAVAIPNLVGGVDAPDAGAADGDLLQRAIYAPPCCTTWVGAADAVADEDLVVLVDAPNTSGGADADVFERPGDLLPSCAERVSGGDAIPDVDVVVAVEATQHVASDVDLFEETVDLRPARRVAVPDLVVHVDAPDAGVTDRDVLQTSLDAHPVVTESVRKEIFHHRRSGAKISLPQ